MTVDRGISWRRSSKFRTHRGTLYDSRRRREPKKTPKPHGLAKTTRDSGGSHSPLLEKANRRAPLDTPLCKPFRHHFPHSVPERTDAIVETKRHSDLLATSMYRRDQEQL